MSFRLGWAFHVDTQPWTGAIRLFVTKWSPGEYRNARLIIEPLRGVEVPNGQPHDIPTLAETRDDTLDGMGDVTNFLQAALDCAWEMGLRPAGAKIDDQKAELAAVRYHLEDMRKLAKVK